MNVKSFKPFHLASLAAKTMGVVAARRFGIAPRWQPIMYIDVTWRCNLRCRLCSLWNNPKLDEISPERIARYVGDAKKLGLELVSIAGGEPMIRKDLEEIVQRISELNVSVHLDTNGAFLTPERARLLKDSGIDTVFISIDGPSADIHDVYRGVDGAFQKAIAGIAAAKDAGIRTGANVLIHKANIHLLSKIASMLSNHGIEMIKFFPVHFGPPYDFGSMQINREYLSEDEINNLEKEINDLKHFLHNRKIIFGSDAYLDSIADFFRGRPNHLTCMAGFLSTTITPDGKMCACYPLKSFVSIGDHSFDKVFRSEKMNDIRKMVGKCTQNCWEYCHAEVSILASPIHAIRNPWIVMSAMQQYLKVSE